MSDWLASDPAWLNARKAEWPEVQSDLERSGSLSARDIKRLKDFFLSGKVDPAYEFKSPKQGGPLPLVFAIWLHPRRTRDVFQRMLSEADSLSLSYTEEHVGLLAIAPPRSIDDVIPYFYELFYLDPSRVVRARSNQMGVVRDVKVTTSFTPRLLWAAFMSWVEQSTPVRNPIVRFLISRLADVSESECQSKLEYYVTHGRSEAFARNFQHILSSKDDPRFEAVHAVVRLINDRRMPPVLKSWLQERNVALE